MCASAAKTKMLGKLDIVIPVYNEGQNIVRVLDALRSSVHTPFRVLICYDDESDDTLEAVRSYAGAPPEIVLVKNRGRGVHGAILSGFDVSRGASVLVLPADDTYNAGIIDRMFEKFAKDGCQIVVASRFGAGGRMEGCPLLKAALVRAAAFTMYHLARVPTRDASNGFRLFSRRVLDQIEIQSARGFTYSIELLVKCHRLGWRIGEVPALWFERSAGRSRFRVLSWVPAYLRWYFYAFGTTYLRRGPQSVRTRRAPSVIEKTDGTANCSISSEQKVTSP